MSTFYDLFRECAERWPQNIALQIQQHERIESYTYAQLRQMAESIGRWLVEHSFEPGTRCAILAENHPRWVAAYLGAIAAGCTAVPLDTAFHADQVAKLLGDSGAVLLFSDSKHLGTASEAIQTSPAGIILLSPVKEHEEKEGPGAFAKSAAIVADLDNIFARGPGSFAPKASAEDAVAALLYTSGTTADPKGVMLTHANLMGEVNAVFSWAKIGPDDAVLGVLPLFHVLSQMANLLLPLVKGARVVHLETLNTTELVRALQERGISAFAVVPQFFYLIHEKIFKEAAKRGALMEKVLRTLLRLNRGFRKVGFNAGRLLFGKVHQTFGSKMRYLVTGGSRFDPKVAQDFHDLGIDVLQAYGLTETSAAAFATSSGDNVIGSVGKALRGVEAKIIDPQPQEEGPLVGEIALRAPTVMKGYWNRPDATAAVLKDGWLHTGDLGYFDSDGNLFITGRQKEVIILSNGKNIYPEEIEAHYLKSPFIKEICVMGLEARPGDPTSDRLYAVVVPDFEVLRQRKVTTIKEVIRYDIEALSAKIATTKRIGSYEIWQEDLPRTTTRKIKRFAVERRVRENQKSAGTAAELTAVKQLTAEDFAWMEQPEVQRCLAVIKERARTLPEQLRPDHNLELDLGLDSMQRVELLVAMEQELGGHVEESQAADIYTVRQLIDAVCESAASGKSTPRSQFAGWEMVLREEPADAEVLALTRQIPLVEIGWFLLGQLLQLISRDWFQLRVRGVEKIPGDGPFILSSNHQSYLDPVVLGSVLPFKILRKTFAVGTSDIFGSGFMRRLARWLRVVVVDPDANLIPAMRAGAYGLRHGKVLILYPEGERSIQGPPITFKKGAAILSIHMQVPIVPIAIEGFHDAWPSGKAFQRFAPLRMQFGDPIYPPPASAASEEAYAQLSAELKRKVMEMWEGLREK